MMESTANYRTQPLSVYAPASVGNMSVGFDALGLALAPIDGTLLGDIVMLSPLPEGAEDWVLEVDGPFAAALPPALKQLSGRVVKSGCRLKNERSVS